jgi:hypothetical protein
LSWFLDSRLPQAFAINLSIENFIVSGSYCQSDKEGVFVKPLSCIASGVLLNPNSGYSKPFGPMNCIHCQSEAIVKNGTKTLKTGQVLQQYLCNTCVR